MDELRREVIVGAMISLDGVMQAPGGPQKDPTGGLNYGGWVAPLVEVTRRGKDAAGGLVARGETLAASLWMEFITNTLNNLIQPAR